ncbi:hypothetical protein ACQKCH_03180 [Nubsella zeaxanthinifaciens]|uniref:hypothetical protein n=1 Tax=Nubsella zeaxanthinifaciens TaxID=392412 RepID=UPI003CFBD4EC
MKRFTKLKKIILCCFIAIVATITYISQNVSAQDQVPSESCRFTSIENDRCRISTAGGMVIITNCTPSTFSTCNGNEEEPIDEP